MSYRYEDVRPRLFTEEVFRLIQQVRDTGANLTRLAGCFHARERYQGVQWRQLDDVGCR